MKEHNERSQLNTIERYACMITLSDPDLMCESNAIDRMTMIARASMLLLVTIIAALAWTAFWQNFLPIWAAIPLGLLLAAFIFGFHQAVGASDWELAGVLRNENAPFKLGRLVKLLVCVCVAVLFAQATSVGATQSLFRSAINNDIQGVRVQKLAPLEADYAKAKADMKNRMISPLETELAAIQVERETLNASLQASVAERDAAQRRASAARIESDREDKGGLKGYIKGRGPLYEEAKRQEIEAARILDAADSNERQARARIDALTPRIDRLRADLFVASRSFDEQVAKLDANKTRDARWQPDESDPMLQYESLERIKNSPERGKAASAISLLIKLLLMTLELSYLLIVMVFNHASVYTVRLIARTKQEAAEVSADYAKNVDEIKRNRPRGNLHVVGGQAPDRKEMESNDERK